MTLCLIICRSLCLDLSCILGCNLIRLDWDTLRFLELEAILYLLEIFLKFALALALQI